ncbi:hypothetical protein MVES_000476 [Malassezia vespertilionis]|uniref:Uncharacterized protein n=1 Tax=Malassezia vespertilionis TaxID=2020962 RepID=A0A2N1JGF1_9BASI|nr:hypothetical protein MVES_000476 [Malassezia vespertilionis]
MDGKPVPPISIHASPSRSLRKFQAVRSPVIGTDIPVELIVTTPPWLHKTHRTEGASRTEIYALVNDRYPGAPGTALAKAEQEKTQSEVAKRRSELRKNTAKAELDRLGVNSVGKKRKSFSPHSSDSTSTYGSDSEQGSRNMTRLKRVRRPTSRQSTPHYLTDNSNDTMSRVLAQHTQNTPAHPSPLAQNAKLLTEDISS